jgi:hypothetical protein
LAHDRERAVRVDRLPVEQVAQRAESVLRAIARVIVPPNCYRIDMNAGAVKVGRPLLGDDAVSDPGRRGYLVKSIAGSSNVTLSASEYINEMIVVTVRSPATSTSSFRHSQGTSAGSTTIQVAASSFMR